MVLLFNIDGGVSGALQSVRRTLSVDQGMWYFFWTLYDQQLSVIIITWLCWKVNTGDVSGVSGRTTGCESYMTNTDSFLTSISNMNFCKVYPAYAFSKCLENN